MHGCSFFPWLWTIVPLNLGAAPTLQLLIFFKSFLNQKKLRFLFLDFEKTYYSDFKIRDKVLINLSDCESLNIEVAWYRKSKYLPNWPSSGPGSFGMSRLPFVWTNKSCPENLSKSYIFYAPGPILCQFGKYSDNISHTIKIIDMSIAAHNSN